MSVTLQILVVCIEIIGWCFLLKLDIPSLVAAQVVAVGKAIDCPGLGKDWKLVLLEDSAHVLYFLFYSHCMLW